ncbi:hypothetical protein LMG28727_07285 [Paraburkholderia kirstenboschensis]|nr:hypothetical protein LMG28727_07285 [Paraburkholderia kirstenboschensis]
MKRAGAGVPSPDCVVLLRNAKGGVAQTHTVFLRGLHSPFGMPLTGNQFYVTDTDALLRFDYVTGATRIASSGVKVADLAAGPINHHWTKISWLIAPASICTSRWDRTTLSSWRA